MAYSVPEAPKTLVRAPKMIKVHRMQQIAKLNFHDNGTPSPEAAFADRLLKRIATMQTHSWIQKNVFLYSVLSTERIEGLKTSHSALCVILQGTKQIWKHGVEETFGPGDIVALPAGIEIDVMNCPSSTSMPYISLAFPLRSTDFSSRTAPAAPTPQATRHRIVPTLHVQAALERIVENLGELSCAHEILELRRQELMLLLEIDPTASGLFRQTVTSDLSNLVSNHPDKDWTVEQAARKLAMSPATLRRKLAREGSRFVEVVRNQRLQTAYRLLIDGASVLESQSLSGFRSRSHFAKHFNDHFGMMPSDVARLS